MFNIIHETGLNVELTEVQAHADKDDKAKPGVKIGDEVDNSNDNVSDGWEDAEHYVAGGEKSKS